jgi:hypothetical protein
VEEELVEDNLQQQVEQQEQLILEVVEVEEVMEEVVGLVDQE